MTFGGFLKNRAVQLVLFAIVFVMVVLMVYVLTGNAWAVLPVAATLLTGCVLAFALRYRRDVRFYREVEDLVERLEHPYQLHALMSRPISPEHAAVFDALRIMGVASANEVSDAKEQARKYREFIELWVHEAKAPLAAALLTCERVPEPERSLVKGDVNKVLREVDQVLWYARAENPNEDYLIREVKLVDMVRSACRKEARGLIERGISVDIAVDEDISVRTDEKQIGFVLSQVVTNAAKYGAAKISFAAPLSHDSSGVQTVALAIDDDGKGIPSSDLPRIFDRGFTGVRGREAGSSTGMGLYIATVICRRIGVSLSASSEVDVGTTVFLKFSQDSRLALLGKEG